MRLPPALRGVPVRALVAALERDGFVLDRQSGSHRIYFNPADQEGVYHRILCSDGDTPGAVD